VNVLHFVDITYGCYRTVSEKTVMSKVHQNEECNVKFPLTRTVLPGPQDAIFFPEKCYLNSYVPRVSIISKIINTRTSIIQHLYREIVKTTMKMILVTVTMIFWVCVMNKLYYGH